MEQTEIARIAKRLNMPESEVTRLGKIADMIIADKSLDHVVEFEDCDSIHLDEGY